MPEKWALAIPHDRTSAVADATALPPETRGGWGRGAPITQSDLLLLRQAISEDWDVSDTVRAAIVNRLASEVQSQSHRRARSVFKTVLAMELANMRTERNEPDHA